MNPRLGVNIDHVATLREARGENYPSVVEAANVAFENGADQITIHLREDRRHIQDTDVEAVLLVTKRYGRPLNLEMGCNDEIIEIAIATGPDWVCLVPEKREERTTEGGLDLIGNQNFEKVKLACEKLREGIPGVKISLFLESEMKILERGQLLSPDAVEIHTGDFARAHLNGDNIDGYLEKYKKAESFLTSHQIGCHAGHGLTQESVKPLIESSLFAEYNIGHWIICRAVFDGLGPVINQFKKSLSSK